MGTDFIDELLQYSSQQSEPLGGPFHPGEQDRGSGGMEGHRQRIEGCLQVADQVADADDAGSDQPGEYIVAVRERESAARLGTEEFEEMGIPV